MVVEHQEEALHRSGGGEAVVARLDLVQALALGRFLGPEPWMDPSRLVGWILATTTANNLNV